METRSRVALVLAVLGFVSLGLPDGLLGAAWPAVRADFALGHDALGALLVAATAGYVASSAASGAALARLGLGALLASSALATAASLLGYALAPSYAVMVALGVAAGLGAGAIDAGLNTHVATRHGARALLWLHACYGVGAASGPLLIAAVLGSGRSWRVGYAVAAAAQGLLAACFVATRRSFAAASASRRRPPEVASALATLRLPAAWLGMSAFFAYVGLEACAGAWLFSVLREARGASMGAAGASASAYWAALAGGRLLFGAFADRVAAAHLLRAGIGGLAAGSALLAAGLGARSDAASVVVLGLAAGPIFPCLIAATPARLGPHHAPNAVGFQVAAAALGQSLLPAAAGLLATRLGLEVVPLVLLGLSGAIFALHESLVRGDSDRRRDAGAAAGIAAACPSDDSPQLSRS